MYVCVYIYIFTKVWKYTVESKEGWKSNFRQYGQMEKHRAKKKLKHGERSERRKSEERKCRCAKNNVFPVFCGAGGSTSRLAKAAGAEPAGKMRDEKWHAAAARSAFGSTK